MNRPADEAAGKKAGDAEWPALVALLRRYSLRKYGRLATGFSLTLPGAEDQHHEPLPPLTADDLAGPA